MGLWNEVLAFKDKHGLYFHPLHDAQKRVMEIEKNNRQCLCNPDRQCICKEALQECRERGSCTCLLFCTKEYLIEFDYMDESGKMLPDKERKKRQLMKQKKKKDKRQKSL